MTDTKPVVAAVIVAAGQGVRMKGIDKVFSKLDDVPIILQATRPFQECAAVSQIVVVVSGGKEGMCRELTAGDEWSKVTDICLGGERRQDSVAAGMQYLERYDWLIIHDAARPLVTVDLIERGLEAARETGAAAAAVPVTDTIKIANDDCIVQETPPRENLWAVQTPQVFRFDVIQIAHRQDTGNVTDDAALVERLGHKVKLFMGAYDNIKITTPDDIAIAQYLLNKRRL